MRQLALLGAVVSAVLSLPIEMIAQSSDTAHMRLEAIALEQRGQNAEAEQTWKSILQADPRNAEAFAHLGLLEARQERLENAIDFYRQAVAINPDLPGLQMNYGLALFKAAQFPNAIRIFSDEIRKHPDDQRLTILLGMAHYGIKDYFVAIPYLQRAAERDPQNLTLRMALARSCLLSKQYQCVIDARREVIARKPDMADADVMAAEALDAMHDTAGAIKDLQAAIQANPDQPNAHFALGYLLWRERRWTEAAREFEAEIQQDPQDRQARIYLADAEVQQKDFTGPLSDLQKLAESKVSEPLVHLDLGLIAAKNGQTEDALRELRTASEQDAENAELHQRIATAYESLGKSEEAKAERNRAIRIGSAPTLLEMLESSESTGS